MLIIGLMSGTSLDGCDAALVEITVEEGFHLIDYVLLPYDITFKEKLRRNLSDSTAKLSEICSLNFELGYKFKDAVDLLLKKSNLKYEDIDYIASHGQTIWHNPLGNNHQVPSTLQIGEPQVISVLTSIPVISNFRVADIIAGGEGAPLVPMFEYLYFQNDNKSVILQNIGGMGNLTYIKEKASIDEIIAFDTGPGNVMIDYYMNKYYNEPFDNDGLIASSGDIIIPILEDLMNDDYLKLNPPKSTGREKYSKEALENLASRLDFSKYEKEDIIATITEYTVQTLKYSYDKFITKYDEVIVSGGGSHNKYIMNRLREELSVKVLTSEEAGINSDAKEAMAFAVLGYLSITNQAGNVRSSTGAKYETVLGSMTLGMKLNGGNDDN